MNIKVNGESQTLDKASLTVSDILAQNQVDKPEMVSVQLNGKFVDPKVYATTALQERDEVDFLYFLGGGRAE